MADWIESRPIRVFLGRHEQELAFARRLRDLQPGEALTVEFGDSPSETEQFIFLPGDPIKFSYRSADDELRWRHLIERCARVLDCDTNPLARGCVVRWIASPFATSSSFVRVFCFFLSPSPNDFGVAYPREL